MLSLFRFGFYFCLSSLILSIQYNSEPLFNSVHKFSGPVTNKVISSISRVYRDFISDIEEKKMDFKKNKVDEISSSLSSTVRKEFRRTKDIKSRKDFFKAQRKNHKGHHGHYDHHDQNQLRKILERE